MSENFSERKAELLKTFDQVVSLSLELRDPEELENAKNQLRDIFASLAETGAEQDVVDQRIDDFCTEFNVLNKKSVANAWEVFSSAI